MPSDRVVGATVACLTSRDAPWVGLFAGNSTSPCSSRGACVDARNASTVFTHLCACDAGWNGANDLFDLRVSRGDSHGGGSPLLSLDCSNSEVGTRAAWSVALAAGVLKLACTWAALAAILWRRRRSRAPSRAAPSSPTRSRATRARGATRFRIRAGTSESTLLRALAMGLIVAVSTTLPALARKAGVVGPSSPALGSDVTVTVMLAFGLACDAGIDAAVNVVWFRGLIRARFSRAKSHERLIRGFVAVQTGAVVLYATVAWIPVLLMLNADLSAGPIASRRADMLVARNVGVAGWAALVGSTATTLHDELKHAALQLRAASGAVESAASADAARERGDSIFSRCRRGAPGSGPRPATERVSGPSRASRSTAEDVVDPDRINAPRSRGSATIEVAAIMSVMASHSRLVAGQAMLTAVVAAIFCAPHLWPYAQYALCSELATRLALGSNWGLITIRTALATRRSREAHRLASSRGG